MLLILIGCTTTSSTIEDNKNRKSKLRVQAGANQGCITENTNLDDLGLSFDLYRGSQVYEDLYNQSTFDMPGSSYFKTGIIYQFNNR